jgi:CSLREA domain-containing protein
MQQERALKGPGLSSTVVGLGLALALLGLASWPLPTHAGPATTITVNTTADELNSDGDCSLREAIQAANTDAAVDACPAGSGADTITFEAATDGTPIVLTGAANEDANATGDLDILDGGDLTIQGNGTGSTIVDGHGRDRVFHVCPGGGCASAVTLNGLTIRNGNPGIAFGGGIYNEGATLNVQSSAIGDTSARNQAWAGGGIYNEAGTTTVDDTAVIANTALGGGGILNDGGTLIVQNGSMVGQFDAGNLAGEGGGIHNRNDGVVTVDGSSVISNTASASGGGIYNGATLTVTNSSAIRGNRADGTNSDDGGGGIYSYAGRTVLEAGSVISNAAAVGGGGIFVYDGTLRVAGSRVISNTAGSYGGAIRNAGTTVVDSSTVVSNTADSYGGGIYNRGGGATLMVRRSSVISNTAETGGGILNTFGTVTVANGSTISGNTADHGGGIYNELGTTTLDASSVIANVAVHIGGGIYNGGTVTVTNGSAIGAPHAGNQARVGGGIYNGEGTTTVTGSSVISNTAANRGGGIYNEVGTPTTVDDSTVMSNAADHGGGMFNRGTLTVTGSRILDNTATTSGGGVYNDADADEATRLTGSCIVGNSDVSFFNNQPAQQIATSNWWGASTGPNTPGADTTGGNVDTSGHLTTPPAHCSYYHIYLPLVARNGSAP